MILGGGKKIMHQIQGGGQGLPQRSSRPGPNPETSEGSVEKKVTTGNSSVMGIGGGGQVISGFERWVILILWGLSVRGVAEKPVLVPRQPSLLKF